MCVLIPRSVGGDRQTHSFEYFTHPNLREEDSEVGTAFLVLGSSATLARLLDRECGAAKPDSWPRITLGVNNR